MKIVVDTNVIFSGIIWGGIPGEIIDEYVRVAENLSQKYPNVAIKPLITKLIIDCYVCEPTPLKNQVSRDPDDDKFIACALGARAETIISGDQDLLVLSGYQGIQIIKPKAFVDSL